MDLDKLKSTWKKSGAGRKNQNEILMMTKIKNHPEIRSIRIKFLIEAFLLIVFIGVYYDGFDGATKPLWANVLLILTAAAYIIIRLMGWIVLRNPVRDGNLKKSLYSFQRNIKRITLSIILTSFLFGIGFISFFASSVDFTKGKYIGLCIMALLLILLVYLSSRKWVKRIKNIDLILAEFNGSSNL